MSFSKTSEIQPLPDPPNDGITSLCFVQDPSSCLLASTSWDGCLRIHNTEEMAGVTSHQMNCGPLLSLAAPRRSSQALFTGGLDGSVSRFDIPTSTTTIIGRHTPDNESTPKACSCLTPLSLSKHDAPILASAGWDSTFHIWDLRTQTPAATLPLPGKAFGMDSTANKTVVATAGRRMCIVDTRKMRTREDDEEEGEEEEHDAEFAAEMVVERESSLKYQTRCVRFFSGGSGLALGSVEGRVAIEYLDDPSTPESERRKKYAFKCHRVNDTVYPVNAIEFHPTYQTTFATGGCDGSVVMWDANNKKRLMALPKFATSVAALAFRPDGEQLAIASSYTYEEGERDHPRDEIFVRRMADQECRPKAK